MAPLLLGTALGGILLLIHLNALSNNPIRELTNQSVEVQGVVATDPKATRSRVTGSRLIESQLSFTMRVEQVAASDHIHSLRVPIRVMTSHGAPIFPGQRVAVSGRLTNSRERSVAGLLIASGDVELLDNLGRVRGVLEKIRSQLREVAMKIGGDSGSLLPGLALGDTSLQSPQFADLMRSAGLSHLTAVSGANFAIVSAFIFALIGALIPRLRIQILVTAIFLILFIILVRPTPSVLRAAAMATVFLIARASGSRRHGASALAVAVMALLIINPFQAFEPGFILSVFATSGLIFLAPNLKARFAQFTPNWLAELFAVAVAASLFCTPYLMFFAGKVSSATIPANVLVAPIIPIITILVFVAAILVIVAPGLSLPLMELANFGSMWIVSIAKLSSKAPEISASPILLLAIFILGVLLTKQQSKWIAPGILLLGLFVILPTLLFQHSDWQIGMCDVGQGDALLINLGGGNAALFDAGPEPELLDRCLSQFNISALPLVVLSHRHADHVNGIKGVGDREIGQVWINQEDPIYGALPNLSLIKEGTSAVIGELEVKSLWPKELNQSFESISGDGSIENNQSIVILAELKGVKILITGDIEPGVQEVIAREHGLESIEILKVPHHGSRFQSKAFLDEISPAISLISVGTNSYGHPNAELIGALVDSGSRVFRSDKDGALALSWRRGELGAIFSARSLGRKWWQIAWH